jgi:hypothetical protein
VYWVSVLKQRSVWREFFPAFIILVNTLSWWTFAYAIFNKAINDLPVSSLERLTLFSFHYVSVAISVILGSVFFPRARKNALSLWMLAGVVTSILLLTIPNNHILVNLFISMFFGVSIGAGLASSLACFADSTSLEHRGFFGGFTFLFVGFTTMLFLIFTLLSDTALTVSMIGVWRLVGLMLFFFTFEERTDQSVRNVPSFADVLRKRELGLYLVPWTMFCLVNWMESPLVEKLFGEMYGLTGLIELIIAGLFALAGGIIADFSGRKRVIIIGFILLGVEYAVLSLLSGMLVSWYVYTALDGVVWGMFASVFFMALWGDLAGDYQKEKYYATGGLPYVLASFFSILVRPYVGMIPLTAAFSFASLFLFLSVLPLMYASETLPERKIRDRELREYVEKAKRVKEKYV